MMNPIYDARGKKHLYTNPVNDYQLSSIISNSSLHIVDTLSNLRWFYKNVRLQNESIKSTLNIIYEIFGL